MVEKDTWALAPGTAETALSEALSMSAMHSLTLAELENLSAESQVLLQSVSVFGEGFSRSYDFPVAIVETVCPSSTAERHQTILRDLEAKGILVKSVSTSYVWGQGQNATQRDVP